VNISNNPPDPIDEVISAYADVISESENWLDGGAVETEEQMDAVDELRRGMRQARLDAEKGEKSESAPIYDKYKAIKERWKPTIDDFKRIEAGLVSLVGDFKKKLAAKKEAERRAAFEEAERKRREAEKAAAKANAADIEAQREAARLAQEAQEAKAAAASAEAVKGLRTVTRYEIADHRAALHWIATNDRDAVTAFIEEYVRRNHKGAAIGGAKIWQEKEAF
jgi:chromosome segregation ATPase